MRGNTEEPKMEFTWDDISKKITEAADFTVKKTEKLTAMAKLEYKLANTKNKLNLVYQEMGKIKFGEMTGDAAEENAYQTLYDKAVAHILAIEELEKALAKLRNYRFCVACGEKIGTSMLFCPKCGTRQDPADSEETASVETLALPAPDADAENTIATEGDA